MGASERQDSTAGSGLPLASQRADGKLTTLIERTDPLRRTGPDFDETGEFEPVVDLGQNADGTARLVRWPEPGRTIVRPWHQIITGWKLALRVTWPEVAAGCYLTEDQIENRAGGRAETTDEEARAIMGAMLAAWRGR